MGKRKHVKLLVVLQLHAAKFQKCSYNIWLHPLQNRCRTVTHVSEHRTDRKMCLVYRNTGSLGTPVYFYVLRQKCIVLQDNKKLPTIYYGMPNSIIQGESHRQFSDT